MNYDPKSLIGTPVDLASLTEYQPGSVVSRMVINKKAGTVTAFAFERLLHLHLKQGKGFPNIPHHMTRW